MNTGVERQESCEDPHVATLRRVAEATWSATRDERRARFHRGAPCPTRVAPYGATDPYARRVHELCAQSGCMDLVHDVIARVLKKLDTTPGKIDDPAAYTFQIASRELIEVKRSTRSNSGFPARPSRNDGVAARVNAELETRSDHRGAWLISLFRILRAYPFSTHHVPGRWPVDGLVEERAAQLPGEPQSRTVVRREIAEVIAIATLIAGHDWVYTNITLPLHAHGNQAELQECNDGTDVDLESAILGVRLREAYLHHRTAGLSTQDSFTRAAVEATGLTAPAITSDLAAALDELEAQASSRPCPAI